MGNAASLRRTQQPQIACKPDEAAPSSSDDDHEDQAQQQQAAAMSSSAAAAPWRAIVEKSLAKNRMLPNSRYIQIATVRPDGRPANRTVVFRGFLSASGPAGSAAAAQNAAGADALTIVTDARSRKVGECAANPRAEVCWYLPKTREQFRIAGTLEIIGAAEAGEEEEAAAAGAGANRLALLRAVRDGAWVRMSDAGREQFFWPHPGQPRLDGDEAAFLSSSSGRKESSSKGNGGADAADAPPPPPPPPPVPATFCLGLLEADEVDHVRLTTNCRTRYVLSQPGGEWSVEEVNP